MTHTNTLIAATEKEISSILAKLETDTGMVLDRLDILDTEVTTLGDPRPQWLRRVRIDMKRLPGTMWS